MRKLLLFSIVVICITMPSMAQDSIAKPAKPVEVKVSGFIMNNMFFDNRKNDIALDGLLLLYPYKEDFDSTGKNDLNKVPTLNLLSFASRLKFGISGPDAFGAKTTGFIEYDFTARATVATLRFRQAWLKMNWEGTELLVGRAWHPLVSTDVLPSVMALSIGAPYQPFNRSDQITVTQKLGKLNVILSAIYQNDYANDGPLPSPTSPTSATSAYQINSMIPNLHLQLKYKSDITIAGLGFDYKRLRPRVSVVSPTKKITTTDAGVNCAAILAYGQIKLNKLTVSAKSIFATNISESIMTGAYGISSYDTITGREEYTPYKHFFVWGNVSYGSKLKVNLFAGYLKNLGAMENIVSPAKPNVPITVFGRGKDIGQAIRISPNVSYTSGKLTLALELEHNIAAYGTIDYANKGKIINTKDVSSTRALVTMLYNF